MLDEPCLHPLQWERRPDSEDLRVYGTAQQTPSICATPVTDDDT